MPMSHDKQSKKGSRAGSKQGRRRERINAALQSNVGQKVVGDLLVAAIIAAAAQVGRKDSALRKTVAKAGPEAVRVTEALAVAAHTFEEALRRGPPPDWGNAGVAAEVGRGAQEGPRA